MTIRTYDPRDVKFTFRGVEIKGFSEGTFIEVGRPSPWFGPPRRRRRLRSSIRRHVNLRIDVYGAAPKRRLGRPHPGRRCGPTPRKVRRQLRGVAGWWRAWESTWLQVGLAVDLSSAVMRALLDGPKIPYTDDGIEMISRALREECAELQRLGVLTPASCTVTP